MERPKNQGVVDAEGGRVPQPTRGSGERRKQPQRRTIKPGGYKSRPMNGWNGTVGSQPNTLE